MTINADNPVREPAAPPAAGNTEAGNEVELDTEGQEEADVEQPEGQDDDGEVLEGEASPPDDDADTSTIEVEHDGKKHKVPAALKPLLMMQADYTRKTQEVAEHRRGVEARETALSEHLQAADKTLDQRARVKAIDGELAEYAKVDWQKLVSSQDPEEQRVFHQLKHQKEQLELRRQDLVGEISHADQKHIQLQRQQFAKDMAAARQQNEINIKGWSEDADDQMVKDAARFYGFTRDAMMPAAANHSLYRVLWDGVRMRRLEEKSRTAPPKRPADTVQPAPSAKVAGKGASVKPGLHDGLPIAEWMRRANALEARKR